MFRPARGQSLAPGFSNILETVAKKVFSLPTADAFTASSFVTDCKIENDALIIHARQRQQRRTAVVFFIGAELSTKISIIYPQLFIHKAIHTARAVLFFPLIPQQHGNPRQTPVREHGDMVATA